MMIELNCKSIIDFNKTLFCIILICWWNMVKLTSLNLAMLTITVLCSRLLESLQSLTFLCLFRTVLWRGMWVCSMGPGTQYTLCRQGKHLTMYSKGLSLKKEPVQNIYGDICSPFRCGAKVQNQLRSLCMPYRWVNCKVNRTFAFYCTVDSNIPCFMWFVAPPPRNLEKGGIGDCQLRN